MSHLHTMAEKIGRGPVAALNPGSAENRPDVRPEYPATRAQLIEACIDCEEGERAWLLGALPDAVFECAADVLTALLA